MFITNGGGVGRISGGMGKWALRIEFDSAVTLTMITMIRGEE